MSTMAAASLRHYDAIVVGSGLAGLTATLSLAQNGLKVVLIEKTEKLGGNSIKASSGINGAPTRFQEQGDSVDLFAQDTFKSGKGLSKPELVDVLTKNSADAVHWLSDECNVDLSAVAMLGGHSFARTHRGKGPLPPGFAIVSALIKKIEAAENVEVLKSTSFHGFRVHSDFVADGVEVEDESQNKFHLLAKNIVLATGGYSADFSSSSLLERYRPDLLHLPSTNGQQTTGDGQKIAEKQLSAKLIDMDAVQIHPTGFIQLKNDETALSKWKFLCGELIRGIGGILLSPKTGSRFVNELTTRDNVTEGVFQSCANDNGKSICVIAVSEKDYLKAKPHIDFYVSQSLMFKGDADDVASRYKGISSVEIDPTKIKKGLEDYNNAIGNDDLGRTSFGNPFEHEFYYGFVTPVLHFTMGGIAINEKAQVLTELGQPMSNVYAIGEVSGGLHGANRLGGSSLLECVVFGREVAKKISK
ncbi:hypothetical protein FT663_00124 [Candidozyma haemuli var. vulneris]|uniref:Fumarate reductase n=1 Tax=Candidozyma haemuli TaxID=45357 RepID=A0A2V1AM87_9ASCO|nr:hypothetical protein CXQ85_001083 [[Candida] haemuloni]KAF3994154.1 hypothetical protein FT662_00023 [[Candida] haemuloni var. vulneris]KAF3995702.1 hypothetical protein FT663_00124 [[Candida] haemuloni var. vulneris]PVH18794.1 hypothetical protein CXQ85_001083 [[Candida] haemuloni]